MVSVYKVSDHHLEVVLPHLLTFIGKSELEILNRTEEKATFYNVTLSGFEVPLQAYVVHITSVRCSVPNSGEYCGFEIFYLLYV